jgi:tetratricopeptide (TPR) repeat protein
VTFADPSLLALLLLPAAFLAVHLLLGAWRRRAARRFAGPQAAAWPASHAWPATAALLLAAVLAVLAMARPQWGERELTRERFGIDLVVALDVSDSMLAADVQPDRLRLAQEAVARLLRGLHGNRAGIVFFAGDAMVRSPLTTDLDAAATIIRRAGGERGFVTAGSDLGAALRLAGALLEASESPGRAVLLVSDGEDHAGGFQQAAADLRNNGVAVFTLGVGTPAGATITAPDARTGVPRLRLDAAGQPVVSRLVEGSLRAIAEAASGRYLRIQEPAAALSIRSDLDALERAPLGEETRAVPLERLQLFAAAALLLLVLSFLLPARLTLSLPAAGAFRQRPGLALLLLVLLTAGACGADSVRDRNAAANRLYDERRYEEALEGYLGLLSERPDLPQVPYNAGNALHRLGDYTRAVQETRRALPAPQRGLNAAAYYSLGNHFFAMGELEEAFQAYKSALLVDPGDGDAKYNLELTLVALRQRQQQTQPGQPAADGQQPPGEEGGEAGEEGEPAAEAPGAPQGQPGGGPPGADPGRPLQEVRRDLEEALAGIEDKVTYEEAVRILNLLREQRERQRLSGTAGGAGPDY